MKFSRSSFKMFFLPYIAIILVLLLGYLLIYQNIYGVLKENSYEYYEARLAQISRITEEKIYSIENLVGFLDTDQTLETVRELTREFTPATIYRAQEYGRELEQYLVSSRFVESICIYDKASEKVLTQSGVRSAEEYFELYIKDYYSNFDYWYNIVSNTVYYRFMPVNKDGLIEVYQSIPVSASKESEATVILSIRAEEFFRELYSEDLGGQSFGYILDRDGSPLFSYGQTEEIGTLSAEISKTGQDKGVLEKDGRISFFNEDSKHHWTYVLSVPYHVVFSELSVANIRAFLILLAFILLGVGFAVFFARRNVLPLRRMIDNIFGGQDEADPASDYLRAIEEAGVRLMEQNRRFKSEAEQYRAGARQNLLKNILNSNFSKEQLEQQLDELGLNIYDGRFCVLLIDIDACHDEDLKKDDSLLRYAIVNMSEELFMGEEKGYILDVERQQIVLILELEQREDNQYLRGLSEIIIAAARDGLYTEISISIGGIHERIEGIHHSYEEALKAQSYKSIDSSAKIFFYDDRSGFDNIFDVQMTNRLINTIKTGEEQAVSEFIDNLNKTALEKKLTAENIRFVYFGMINALKSVAEDMEKDIDLTEEEAGVLRFEDLYEIKELELQFREIKLAANKLCAILKKHKKDGRQQLAWDIENYVGEKFSDPYLSLNDLAEAFHLSPTYISHFMSENMDNTFVGYVRALRIEKAKELLRGTDLTVDGVAKNVGYTNSVVFIRNFKKETGLTPSQYRNSN